MHHQFKPEPICSTPVNMLTNRVASPHRINGNLGRLAWDFNTCQHLSSHSRTWPIGLKFCMTISITIFKTLTIGIFPFACFWAHYLTEGLDSLETTFRVRALQASKIERKSHSILLLKFFSGMHWYRDIQGIVHIFLKN